MGKYKHEISLGWFCGVSEELEKLGLRTASYPFDWILSDFQTVYEIAVGNCTDYLNAELLIQDAKNRNMYRHRNRKCLIYVHDIHPYRNLQRELEQVVIKYQRRLERFRKDIQEPCIFLRYIMDAEEYQMILNNRDGISQWIKSYHPDNQIIYIADQEWGMAEGIWSVQKDPKDTVARSFLSQLPELRNWLTEQDYDFSIEENLERYKKSQRKKKLFRYPKKVQNKWYQLCWLIRGNK